MVFLGVCCLCSNLTPSTKIVLLPLSRSLSLSLTLCLSLIYKENFPSPSCKPLMLLLLTRGGSGAFFSHLSFFACISLPFYFPHANGSLVSLHNQLSFMHFGPQYLYWKEKEKKRAHFHYVCCSFLICECSLRFVFLTPSSCIVDY